MANNNYKRKNFKKGPDFSGKEKTNSGGSKSKFDNSNIRNATHYTAKDVTETVGNDPKYYTKNQIDFDRATAIQWANIQGRPLDFGVYGGTDPTTSLFQDYINEPLPGIMRVEFMYGPGWTQGKTDAVNIAFSQIMADLYAKTQASSLGFDQASLCQYVQSGVSIAANLAAILRIMKSRSFWVNRNINYPRAMVTSMGIDYDDLVENINTYIPKVNECVRMFNNMRMPHLADQFDRVFAMCHNVYVDEDSTFGQIYYFMPANYYTYTYGEDKIRSVSADIYQYVGTPDVPAKLSGWIDLVKRQLDALYNSNDFYLINGTLAKSYSEINFLFVPEIDLAQIINPTTDNSMQMQLMNATILPVSAGSCTVDQVFDNSTGSFHALWRPEIPTSLREEVIYTCPVDGVILRYFGEDPSKEDNMEMTRLTNLVDLRNRDRVYVTDATPEIVTAVKCYVPTSWSSEAGEIREVSNITHSIWDVDGSRPNNELMSLFKLANFRYIPTILLDSDNFGATLLGDQYNYKSITREVLANMNRVAALSLWAVGR